MSVTEAISLQSNSGLLSQPGRYPVKIAKTILFTVALISTAGWIYLLAKAAMFVVSALSL